MAPLKLHFLRKFYTPYSVFAEMECPARKRDESAMRPTAHTNTHRPSLSIAGDGLRGEPFAAADWPVLQRLFADPRTAKWLLRDPEAADLERRARRIAHGFAEGWASDGFGPYVIRVGPRAIGYAGLRRSRLDAQLETEALFAIDADWQGAGRATRAMRAVIAEYDAADPNAPQIASWTQPSNRAALKVIAKLGFAYERDAVWAGLRHVVHRLPAAATPRAGRPPRAGAA